MPVYNAEIAETLNRVADLLEIEGANQFRVRAYRRAARTINGHPRRMADLVEEGADLTKLAGIGEDMAGKIQELVRTGELEQLRALEERVPSALAEMLKLAGLGPKRVQQLYAELRIDSLEKLRAAAQHGEMQELEGLGPKTQAAVLDDLERQDTKERRTRLSVAEQMVEPLVAYLRDDESSARVEVAGSYRRRKETVGDLAILVTSEDGAYCSASSNTRT
jgi:DNA polymerase (family 10)